MIVFSHLQSKKTSRKILAVRPQVQTVTSAGILEHLIRAISVNFRGLGNRAGRCFTAKTEL